MAPEMILVETHGKTGLIRLNRPQALNALCDQLMIELGTALRAFDKDPAIAAIIITGSEKAFAAGADIKEMKERSFPGVYFNDFIGANWETVLVNSIISLRHYDAAGMCLYDLGIVVPGEEAGAALRARIGDPRVAYVNIHTARPGCWLTRVEKI